MYRRRTSQVLAVRRTNRGGDRRHLDGHHLAAAHVDDLYPTGQGRSGQVGDERLHLHGVGPPLPLPRPKPGYLSVVLNADKKPPRLRTRPISQADDGLDEVAIRERPAPLSLELDGVGLAASDQGT